MGLLVTSYLVLINIAAGNSDRYRLDAFTAVDAWLYGCKILVTLAIFEYAWILKMRELDTRQRMKETGWTKGAQSWDLSVYIGYNSMGTVATLAPELQASQAGFLPELKKAGKFF